MRIYGYRTSKTVGGTTTDYTLEGDRVLIEKTGSDYVWFYYDAAGAPVAMATGSGPSLYIYRKNLQGDITGIYSGTTGTLLVSYVYNAWGKVTATNVANTTESSMVLARNPYLYRGYRYDVETGLYYLNSRYYDPETGRFINADGFVSTGQGILGSNMFAYCENNPVNESDSSGYASKIAVCTYEDSLHGGLEFVRIILFGTLGAIALGKIITTSFPVTKKNIIVTQSKGHQGNMRDSGLVGDSNEEVQKRYKDPNTSKKEKRRLQKELKARRQRDVKKRKNYVHFKKD